MGDDGGTIGPALDDVGTKHDLTALLRELRGGRTITALAEATGLNRRSISRFLLGEAEPLDRLGDGEAAFAERAGQDAGDRD